MLEFDGNDVICNRISSEFHIEGDEVVVDILPEENKVSSGGGAVLIVDVYSDVGSW